MSVHAGQRAGRAIRDVPRTKNTAGTSRSMESSKPSGAQQPQLPAAGAQRRRQHLSWPRSMRRCHARQWLAAELQPAHEPRRRQSAAVRASAVKRGRLRGVAAATAGALSTNRDILYFLMLSCSRKRRSGRLSAPVAGTPNNGRTAVRRAPDTPTTACTPQEA